MNSLFQECYTESLMDDNTDTIITGKGRSAHNEGEYHLKSALRSHSDYVKNKHQAKDLLKLSEHTSVYAPKNPCKLLPTLWRGVIEGEEWVEDEVIIYLRELYHDDETDDCALELLDAELEHVCHDDDKTGIMQGVVQCQEDAWNKHTIYGRANILRWALTRIVIDHNKEEPTELSPMGRKLEDRVFAYSLSSSLSMMISRSWCHLMINDSPGTINIQHLINTLDKLTERVNIMTYLTLCNKTGLSSIYPSVDITLKIIQLGDNLILNEGNDAFRGLASYEAICVGEIINRGDSSVWDVGRFLNTMLQEVGSLGENYKTWSSDVLVILQGLKIQQVSCLHGMYRIWGHPVVDLEKGLLKLRSVALMEKEIPPECARNTSNMFKEIFFTQYFRRHRFYPPHTWTGPEGSNYIKQVLSLEKELDIHNIRYHLEDWENIRCEKTFEIPATYSLASCIKDRAISPKRSELVSMIIRGGSVMSQSSRRGVLKWLDSTMIPVREFLDGIDESGLSKDNSIIGLYPKERELKMEARFFALMSFQMRLYFTITEHMANDNLLDYFPMVTMSDSMLELNKKLDTLSRKQVTKKEGVVHYVVNIDFRKWNQQMREEMTVPMFLDADRLFGYTNLVGRTHEIFKSSYIYLSSGEYVPQVSLRGRLVHEEPYSWTNDPSGKEGLRQKYWTIMTACDLMYVARQHGLKIDLVGGGDNQVLIVEVTTDKVGDGGELTTEGKSECKFKMGTFMRHLSNYMEKKGLPLKTEETWISPNLLMFFKMMYYDHTTLVSPLKQASRVFPLSNDQVMTIGNMAATVSSGVTVLSSKDMQIGPAAAFGRLICADLASLVTKDHPLSDGGEMWSDSISICRGGSRRKVNVKPDLKTPMRIFLSLTLLHKVMGGPAIVSPLGMMMRGFPDPLCEHLTWISMIKSKFSQADNFACMSINTKVPWAHLLEDPVSVNHDAPMHGLAVLRREAEQALAKASGYKNRDFMDLARCCNKSQMEGLAEALCSGKNVDIRVLHDVMGASLGGYFNSIASKVNKTATVLRMNKSSSVIATIAGQERHCMSYFAASSSVPHDLTPLKCPTATARRYRRLSWGKEILSITTPHPAAFLKPVIGDHQCDHNYVQTKTSGGNLINPHSRGPYPVYMGSYTREKFKPTEMAAAYGEEDLLSRPIHLMKLINWRYSSSSNMAKILKCLLSSLTDADATLFYGMMEWIAGDAEHRYQDMATKHGGVPNVAHSILSYVRAHTTTFRKHSRGGKNETLHFQAVMIYTSMIALFKKYGGIIHWHESCGECIQQTVGNVDVVLTKRVEFPILKGNLFAYVPAESIKFHYHDMKRIRSVEDLGFRTVSYESMSPLDRRTASISMLSAVISSSESRDKSSVTMSSIEMWAGTVNLSEIIPAVCLRVSVAELMRTGEWSWPKPHLKKRIIMLLEPFIRSKLGRYQLLEMGVTLDELRSNNPGVLLDIVQVVMDNSRMTPKIIPNRVSPSWVNDVICAKIYENEHVIFCSGCLTKGPCVDKVEICNDILVEYTFKVCSATLPVLKGDMSQIICDRDFSNDPDWTSSPVQLFEMMDNPAAQFTPFPRDGPIAVSRPLGSAGLSSILDILAETNGIIMVGDDSVSITIWRQFRATRKVMIFKTGDNHLEAACDFICMAPDEADLLMDSESPDGKADVYYGDNIPIAPGWWIITSRRDVNRLYKYGKDMSPTRVLISKDRGQTRAICAVKMEQTPGQKWGDFQATYKKIEMRCGNYSGMVRNPTSKNKLISCAVSLFHRVNGDIEEAVKCCVTEMRTIFWRNESYTKKAKDLMYLMSTLHMAGMEGGIEFARRSIKPRAVRRPYRILIKTTARNNYKAANDVTDVRELFRVTPKPIGAPGGDIIINIGK
nr:RNA-dependent RNA polymerase [Dichorhavirus orchidaceae]